VAFVWGKFTVLGLTKFTVKSISIDSDVKSGNLKLGKRIYAVRNGCIDCHGANLSGKKIMDNLPMGSIHGANITPYALKDWSDGEIAAAIRYGVHKSGRSLKFMPSFDFVKLSKSDIASLITYIRSVGEVRKDSHQNSFGPVARILTSLGKMPLMYPAHFINQSEGFYEKPMEGPTVKFGEYLANSCVGCHGDNYRGGKIPGGDPVWPAASNIRLGADSTWTENRFRQMLKTGISAKTGKILREPMPIALLKQFDEIEKKALWLFLSQLK
jgi:mono/diheme cytochrome c family protein